MAREYVPALGFRALTPAYDVVVGATTRERTVKQALVEQAGLVPGQQVLDLACGTATLSLLAARACPGVEVTGLDGDPEMLARARRKADRAEVAITLDEGLSFALPYADASFDRVLCSLFFHHLSVADKSRTAAEVLRVLRAGGELHVADWGRPSGRLTSAGFRLVQLLDGHENTEPQRRGELPGLLGRAGFDDVRERTTYDTMFGTMHLLSAVRPS